MSLRNEIMTMTFKAKKKIKTQTVVRSGSKDGMIQTTEQ